MMAVAYPAFLKAVATDFASASFGTSMPLLVTPCVDGYCPVRIVARDGWQYGFCVRHLVKLVPSRASRSSVGVEITGLPHAAMVSARCWSVVMSRTFVTLASSDIFCKTEDTC